MENFIDETISYCKKNNRTCIEGKLTNEFKYSVSIKDKSEFWNLFENSTNATLVLDKRINKISSEDIIAIEKPLQEIFSEEIAIVNDNGNKIHSIKLYFCIDNFIVKFKKECDWIREFKLVKNLILDPEFYEDLLKEPKCEDDRFKRLSDEERKELTQEILKDERFETYLTPVQLSQLLTLIFDEKNYNAWKYNELQKIIEARYNNNMKPIHEKQLRAKIQELKKTKIAKTAICSELNIGMSLLNKYF